MTAINYVLPDDEEQSSDQEHVILVDHHDEPVGTAEKIFAHQHNLLHRAFSIFIFRFNDEFELLLQQRAQHKYHSAGLWTNTCCSHPRPGESVLEAAKRRLAEEMGIDCILKEVGWFHYNAVFDNGLAENEIDHIVLGYTSAEVSIQFNTKEVQNYRWISIANLKKELHEQPGKFTAWLQLALNKLGI